MSSITKSCRKLWVGSGTDAIANDQAEEISADDARDAADDRADQPFQADLAQANFEQNDGKAEEHSHAGRRPALQPEGLQFVAGERCNEDK